MNKQIDFDACVERWKYYQKRYPNLEIDLEKVRFPGKDKSGRGKWKYDYIELSGDCFFNFNDKKLDAFMRNIQCETETAIKLHECAMRHYSNENCVLMPVTGGLNKVKGKIYYKENHFIVAGVGRPTDRCYDRPDTFIFYLNDFFVQKKKNWNILSAGKYLSNSIFKEALQSFNYADLYSFLDGFEDVYDYCDFFYGMDDKFVDRMIDEGKQPISVDKDLRRYIQLAEDFWQLQSDIIRF